MNSLRNCSTLSFGKGAVLYEVRDSWAAAETILLSRLDTLSLWYWKTHTQNRNNTIHTHTHTHTHTEREIRILSLARTSLPVPQFSIVPVLCDIHPIFPSWRPQTSLASSTAAHTNPTPNHTPASYTPTYSHAPSPPPVRYCSSPQCRGAVHTLGEAPPCFLGRRSPVETPAVPCFSAAAVCCSRTWLGWVWWGRSQHNSDDYVSKHTDIFLNSRHFIVLVSELLQAILK